jgi:hypothetical protein
VLAVAVAEKVADEQVKAVTVALDGVTVVEVSLQAHKNSRRLVKMRVNFFMIRLKFRLFINAFHPDYTRGDFCIAFENEGLS